MLTTIELSGLTADNAVERVTAALSEALGWAIDEDGARLWCDDTKSLGVKVTNNSSNVGISLINAAETSAGSGIYATISAAVCIDYGKSKEGTAVIVGLHSANAAKLAGGTIVIAEKDDGEKCGIISASNSINELQSGALPYKAVSALKTENVAATCEYTSLYRLPSYFGGLYKEVYGVYSSPAPASGLLCTAKGRTFQLSQQPSYRFAVEVG